MNQPPDPSRQLAIRACAKLNLTLEVLGRRSDGYHELRSVFQTIDLHDTLEISTADEIAVECGLPDLRGEANLIYRAAGLLRETCQVRQGAAIVLNKRIPVAAGLGGGSSDAAAALLGLRWLWNLRLQRDDLLALAAQIGSDVSFFLLGGTALAEGRGERLRPLPSPSTHWVLIVRPDLLLPDKTRRLYAALQPDDYADGRATRRLIEALEGSGSESLNQSLLTNSFERAARQGYPEVDSAWIALLDAGAPSVQLAGSGPSVYSLFDSKESAERVRERLAAQGFETYISKTIAGPAVKEG